MRNVLKRLRDDLEQPLKEVGDKHNVMLSLGNASYNPDKGTATFKLNVAVKGEDGEERDLPAEEFKANARLVGLNPDDLHREIRIYGGNYKIVGFKPKARKNNIIIRNDNGTDYVCSAREVKDALQLAESNKG